LFVKGGNGVNPNTQEKKEISLKKSLKLEKQELLNAAKHNEI
jgi:hypothetical protein